MSSPAIDAYLDELLDTAATNDGASIAASVPVADKAASTEIDELEAVFEAAREAAATARANEVAAEAAPAPVSEIDELEALFDATRAATLAAQQTSGASGDRDADAATPVSGARTPIDTHPLPAPPPRAPAPAAAAAVPVRSAITPVAPPPSPVATTHRWLRVSVGDDSYAVELLRVQEVGRTVPIVAMRGAAAAVLGAMNLRGRIVPVFDLGLWLGTGRVKPDERARIVVVERDNELIGALVSSVEDVVTLGPDRIEPPLLSSTSRALVGVARVTSKPTVLLDANALFG